MRTLIFGAALLVAACSQEATAPTPDAAAPATNTEAAAPATGAPALAGAYTFFGDNLTAASCSLVLDGRAIEGAPGFYGVTLGTALVTAGVAGEVPCEEAYPFLSVLTGWEDLDDGGIRLIGAAGSVFGDFRLADGAYSGVIAYDGKTYGLAPETL